MSVIVFDCDGVLRPIKNLISVAVGCLREYFKIEITEEQIGKMVSSLSGGTFTDAFFKALKFLVPGYDEKKAEQCYKELSKKREAIYKEAEVFPEVIEVVKQLSKNPNLHLIISSGIEKNYIKEWLTKIGIVDLFEEIYSVVEDGEKKKHIQMIRQKYSGEKVVFIGDAISEMQLRVPAIGVARESWQREPLMKAGAKRVISSLDELLDALQVVI